MEVSDLVRFILAIVGSVVTSTLVLLGGAYAVRRYAGPAQSAYTDAIEGRVKLLMAEREDDKQAIDALRAEVGVLRARVVELERQILELTVENADLLREQAGRVTRTRASRTRASQ